jgi:hypothetical protein
MGVDLIMATSIMRLDMLDRPYNDDTMTYDYSEQRYIPLVDGILENGYVNLIRDWRTEDNAQSYLDLLSRVVYETILSMKDSKYRFQMKYYMAHSKQARQEIFNLMADSVWYNRRDGGFMMAYNSGANLNQGKLVEFGIDKALSSIAKQMVKNTYLGTRYLPYDLNKLETFDEFADLTAYLVTNDYFTQDEVDLFETIDDIVDDGTFRVYEELNGVYVFKELNTIEKAKEKMKIYNNTSGTW